MRVLLFLCLAVLARAADFQEEWNKFKAEHGKTYSSDGEEAFRFKVFKENQLKVARHNVRFDRGEVSFRVAINRHSDLLPHEVAERFNGYQGGLTKRRQPSTQYPSPPRPEQKDDEEMPEGWPWPFPWPFPWPWNRPVDWRKKGHVTPVKDQGQCGSCWAFSATGSLEGQLFRKTGKLVSLSEQNLVDCSGEYGNYGCGGGLMDQAFQYIQENGGIDTESSYPYTGVDGTCNYSDENSGGTVKGYVNIKSGSEEDLKAAVKSIGPISIAIDASQWSFQQYGGGIYFEEECSSEMLDHGVLLVGYGSDGKGKDYWLVKNSWGPSWGEAGYIKMARNRDNNCGIATEASYPIV